jgi:hypothetical protein
MFGSLKRIATKLELSKSALKCPACGVPAKSLPDQNDGIITCHHCQHPASIAEYRAANLPTHQAADPASPPPGTRIRQTTPTPGTLHWHIPASGNSGGLLLFGIFWLAITAIVSGGFLIAALSGSYQSSSAFFPGWILIPFFTLFWAIGLVMLYAGFRSKFSQHEITLTPTELTHRQHFGPRTRLITLPRHEIQTIGQVLFYTKNYEPVYGLQIRSARHKIRFGSTLTEPEKNWLNATLNQAVFPPSPPADPITHPPQDSFSIPIPPGTPVQAIATLFGIAMGILFILIGIFVLDDIKFQTPTKSDGFFKIFDALFSLFTSSFRVLWITLCTIITLVIALSFLRQLRKRSIQHTLEANRSEVSIRQSRHGRILSEKTLPRHTIIAVRHFPGGIRNDDTGYQIELLTESQAIPLVTGTTHLQARTFTQQANQSLALNT